MWGIANEASPLFGGVLLTAAFIDEFHETAASAEKSPIRVKRNTDLNGFE